MKSLVVGVLVIHSVGQSLRNAPHSYHSYDELLGFSPVECGDEFSAFNEFYEVIVHGGVEARAISMQVVKLDNVSCSIPSGLGCVGIMFTGYRSARPCACVRSRWDGSSRAWRAHGSKPRTSVLGNLLTQSPC